MNGDISIRHVSLSSQTKYGVLRDLVHRLYQGVLYFHATRVNVHKKNMVFTAPIFTKPTNG
jgi:hypothetical protein